jgi:hypothetical protein
MLGRGGCKDVFQAFHEDVGFATKYSVKQGHLIHRRVLDRTILSCGDETVDELKSSPIDRWTYIMDQLFVG